MAIALILQPVRNEREGGSSGPSYVTTAALKARNKARRWITRYYHITPAPLSELGWVLGTRHLTL